MLFTLTNNSDCYFGFFIPAFEYVIGMFVSQDKNEYIALIIQYYTLSIMDCGAPPH